MNSETESETWFTSWEEYCISTIDNQPNYQQTLSVETEKVHGKIWTSFQDSATAIAQLYKDRCSNESGQLWSPFQTAAGSVSALYKDTCDALRSTNEVAVQYGYQNRNIEIFNWVKKRRRHIKREDLLAFLAGKPQQKPNNYHRNLRTSPKPRNSSPPPAVTTPSLLMDTEMTTFREALSHSNSSKRSKGLELCAFINGELARHRKRAASPSDITMRSLAQSKRPKLI